MKLKSKKTRSFLKWSVIIVALVLFCIWQNNDVVTTNITYTSSKIPSAFDGYKIVQLSDLHNKEFGKNQTKLLDKIRILNPDIIVVTGDLIDHKRTNITVAMELINGAVKIAPVYYVSGNNEAMTLTNAFPELCDRLTSAGVIMMDNSVTKIEKNGSYLKLLGVSDPSFVSINTTNNFEGRLRAITEKNDVSFKILLSHRPELMDIYADHQMDLVFSGHAHGGQFRIPSVGGLFAPSQGYFPKYTSGTYYNLGTTMIVSRGLGNSVIPIRIFNRPEIICATLKVK